ncbi:DUF3343 domain-containing protein [Clostridium sp. DJ247]|uniref:DUF3343 domain-containing protein n=1 Tax=Clostridium sp. DJ247 TaxID=2726188 RepID=UPI001625CCA3|nr:DUF3343 domain-containing protein [Clostridium sp. DJ247]MBC2582218.1 DUF3343 domain-containing protein [Clostridium sp. DJ247]
MNNYYILTFENTHGAISAENILKGKNIKLDIMPTPTGITRSCGISIRVNDKFISQVKSLIEAGELSIKNVYINEGMKYKAVEM